MSFRRVSDLLRVCVVRNHDADSPLLSLQNDIFIENKRENAIGKVCLLVVEYFDSPVIVRPVKRDCAVLSKDTPMNISI